MLLTTKVCVVGLGLIGGSIAKALKGKVARLTAIDTDPAVLQKASSLLDEGSGSPELIGDADLVILSIYPDAALDFVKENAHLMRSGALLTDAVGVKSPLMALCQELDLPYIGTHPMAGKEVGGFDNADGELFSGANFIIVPPGTASLEHMMLIEQLAKALGCGTVTHTNAETHDRIISYTSQLPHIIATAMCDTPLLLQHRNFTGGSFEDVTRVAKINENLWSQLFLQNADYLSEEIEHFLTSLQTIKDAIDKGDSEALTHILRRVRIAKEEVDRR